MLLEQHIVKGEIVEQLWRGQMGLSDYDQKKALELWLQNGDRIDLERCIRYSSRLDDPACGSQPEATGCCQPDKNCTYCSNPILSDDEDNLGSNIAEAKLASVKSKSKKGVSRSNSHKGPGLRKVLCAMLTGMKTGSKKIHMLLLLFCVLLYQLVLPTVATNN